MTTNETIELYDENTPRANARQVGGSHYKAHGKANFQHWDMVEAFKLSYFEGQITKYVMRWRDKNGIEDLKKGLHYLQKLRELWSEKVFKQRDLEISCGIYHRDIVVIFGLDFFQGTILKLVMFWQFNSLLDLKEAETLLKQYIAIEEAKLADEQHNRKAPETEIRANDVALALLFEASPYLERLSNGETKIPSSRSLKDLVTRVEALLDTNIPRAGNHSNVGVSIGQERNSGSQGFNPPAGTR